MRRPTWIVLTCDHGWKTHVRPDWIARLMWIEPCRYTKIWVRGAGSFEVLERPEQIQAMIAQRLG